jgi:hypothetical protein
MSGSSATELEHEPPPRGASSTKDARAVEQPPSFGSAQRSKSISRAQLGRPLLVMGGASLDAWLGKRRCDRATPLIRCCSKDSRQRWSASAARPRHREAPLDDTVGERRPTLEPTSRWSSFSCVQRCNISLWQSTSCP